MVVYVCTKIICSDTTSFNRIHFKDYSLWAFRVKMWTDKRRNFHLTAVCHTIRYLMGGFMSFTKIASIGHFQKQDIGLITSLASSAMVIPACLQRMMLSWFEYSVRTEIFFGLLCTSPKLPCYKITYLSRNCFSPYCNGWLFNDITCS